jgi:hypothetical protein
MLRTRLTTAVHSGRAISRRSTFQWNTPRYSSTSLQKPKVSRRFSLIELVLCGAFGAITKHAIDSYIPTQSKPKPAGPNEVNKAINELQQEFKEDQVLTAKEIVTTYGSSDNSYHPNLPHAVVVIPNSTEDVVKIVNIARKWQVPIVPYSAATSLEGHFSGVRFTFLIEFFSCPLKKKLKDVFRKYMCGYE